MKALILAAGLGTRLRPLTEKTPKPLLPIGGKPLLQYHLEQLEKVGVTDILVNTHYLREQIETFVTTYKQSHPNLNLKTVFEKELLGSAGTLKANEAFFADDRIVVIYADNLTNIEYKNLFKQHERCGGIATIACYQEKDLGSKGEVLLDGNECVLGFKEKDPENKGVSGCANGGIYVFEPQVFTYLQVNTHIPFDFGSHLFPTLIQAGMAVYAYPIQEFFLDIGTPENYKLAQEKINTLNL